MNFLKMAWSQKPYVHVIIFYIQLSIRLVRPTKTNAVLYLSSETNPTFYEAQLFRWMT